MLINRKSKCGSTTWLCCSRYRAAWDRVNSDLQCIPFSNLILVLSINFFFVLNYFNLKGLVYIPKSNYNSPPFFVRRISINKWLTCRTFSPCSLECEVYRKKNKCACTIVGVCAPHGGGCHNLQFSTEGEGRVAGRREGSCVDSAGKSYGEIYFINSLTCRNL